MLLVRAHHLRRHKIQPTFEAFNDNTTLRGRKIISQALFLSKINSALTTFTFSEKQLHRVQKLIDKFCHKKKIVSGPFKYLSFSRGGVQIPLYYVRYLVARAAMLKNLHTKMIEKKTLPSWGQILLKSLKFLGFKDPKLLFRTMHQGDVSFVYDKLSEMGFTSLAGLFQSSLILAKIHDNRKLYGDIGERKAKKDFKQRKDQSNNDDPFYTSTCLQYFRDSEGKIFKNRPLGIKDVVFSNWRSLRDCFAPGFRSMSLIGNEIDPIILQRNKKFSKDQYSLHGWQPVRNLQIADPYISKH